MPPTIIDFSKKAPLQQAREEVKNIIKNDYSTDNSFSFKKPESSEEDRNSVDISNDVTEKEATPSQDILMTEKLVLESQQEPENFGPDEEEGGKNKMFSITTPPAPIDIDSPDFALPKSSNGNKLSKLIGFLAPIFWNAVCFVLGALFIIVLNR
jgi:hypothetical protein